jgi:hypothetical protein
MPVGDGETWSPCKGTTGGPAEWQDEEGDEQGNDFDRALGRGVKGDQMGAGEDAGAGGVFEMNEFRLGEGAGEGLGDGRAVRVGGGGGVESFGLRVERSFWGFVFGGVGGAGVEGLADGTLGAVLP